MAGKVSTPPEVRFMALVKEQRDGCWQWVGSSTPKGYGTFSFGGKKVIAHRWAYSWFNGEIPNGFDVLHSCDNPGCVNPEHLSTGTRSENMKQCSARGRSANQYGTSKMTPAKVRQIRRLKGRYEYAVIAEKYGVCTATISHIMNGRTWGHV